MTTPAEIPTPPGNNTGDPIQIIIRVASELGIPPELALAIAAHESGFNTHAVGDNGTSFGLYQLHEGGELPSAATPQWAYDPLNNAKTALSEVARVYHSHPNLDWGTIAALAQRPADAQAYAQDVNDILRRSGRGQHAVNYFSSAYHTGQFAEYIPPGGNTTQQSTAAPAAKVTQESGVPNTIGNTTSSNSNSGGGAGSATPNLTPSATKADFIAGLNAAGFAEALINSDPSLKKVFQEAIQQGWYKSDTGLSRFEAAIRNTKWWSSRSVAQRNFDELKFSDPREFSRQIGKQVDTLQNTAGQMGLTLQGGALANLARLALRNGLSDQEIQKALAGHFQYNPNESYTGTSGSAIDSIHQLSGDYYVPVSNPQMQKWVQQIDAGALDPNSLKDYFVQQASSLFPHLADRVKAGQTIASIADPYKQLMAQTLEIDPGGIKNSDQTVMKALQQPDGKGGQQLMPLWQFQQTLRQDPRWMQTNNARDSLIGIGSGLLSSMGLIA